MWICFENELGSLRMEGGGDSMWRLVSVEGLEPVEYQAETVNMSSREGQVTSSLSSLARTITLKGDIVGQGSEQIVTKASEILSREGYLKICKNAKKRKIKARPVAFIPERDRGNIREFVMQFVCDDPFFTDFEQKEIKVSTIENLLYKHFCLGDGIYFSIGSCSKVIDNRSTKNAEPVIKITSPSSHMQGDKLTITNETAGQTLIINHILAAEDNLEIHIPQRVIRLNGQVRYDILDEDCFLSEFYLLPGKNLISVDTGSNSDRLEVVCIYDNRYTEAIV